MSNSFMTPWTVACQIPMPMGFPRQEYWSRLTFPSPGNLPNHVSSITGGFFTTEPPGKLMSSFCHMLDFQLYLNLFEDGLYFSTDLSVCLCFTDILQIVVVIWCIFMFIEQVHLYYSYFSECSWQYWLFIFLLSFRMSYQTLKQVLVGILTIVTLSPHPESLATSDLCSMP